MQIAVRLMKSNNLSILIESLTEEKIQILLSGLASLEAALKALQQPVPRSLEELQRTLSLQLKPAQEPFKDRLSTREAALMLGCSPRRVRQLGREGRIKLIRQGHQGRGRSSAYDTETVLAYARETLNNASHQQ
jgi:hypothetical protein